MFNPINDTLEKIRRTYIPLLGRLVSAYNESRGTKYYVEGGVYDSQFLGRVAMGEERPEKNSLVQSTRSLLLMRHTLPLSR